MRKITKSAAAAFTSARNFRDGSTVVESDGITVHLLLHGNCIARNGPATGLQVNLCGWNTPTTRDRLNSLPGVRAHTKQGQAYLNGKPIPSSGWVTV
jgi:hypothetical protein